MIFYFSLQVVDQLEKSGARNGVAPLCEASRLDWLDLATLAPAQRGAADLVLLADVIYAEAVVGPLVATLLLALHPQGELQGCMDESASGSIA